jgi:hypothetical protein
VPEHQDAAQLRAARHRRGDPRLGAAIRPQAERFTRPSKANEAAFERAVDEVTRAAHQLIDSLVSHAPPRDRDVEAAKARARAAERFGTDAGRGG